jgi:hypothetical protein
MLALMVGALASCNYAFQAGAGLPPHVETLAVIPFENDTDRFELPQELQEVLLEELPNRFGIRTAGEEFAEAVVRGTVRGYNVETPSFRPGPAGDRTEVIERQVSVTVEVQVIDRVNNVILWENASLSGRGEFLEASELEEDGRRVALSRVAQSIIDGLQSNW